jgi:hypothetical protein
MFLQMIMILSIKTPLQTLNRPRWFVNIYLQKKRRPIRLRKRRRENSAGPNPICKEPFEGATGSMYNLDKYWA